MNRALQIIGAVILCLTTSFADPTTAAIATAIGEVTLNGSALTYTNAVFDGDRLTTGSSAALILHLVGSSIHIGPNSDVRYRGRILELVSGTGEVQGRETVLAGPFTVAPVGEARFRVQRESGWTALQLLSGTVRLSRGNDLTTLAVPGQYDLQDDQPVPAVKRHTVSRTLPVVAGAAAAASTIIAHWLTGRESGAQTSCVSSKSPSSCK